MKELPKILEYIKNITIKNLPWKVASLVLAFSIWFITLNFIDPIRTQTITIPLQLINEEALTNRENEIIITNPIQLANQFINVQVHGPSAAISTLNLEAFVNLGTAEIVNILGYSGSVLANVQVGGNFGSNVEWLATRPHAVTINLDTILPRDIEVTLTELPELLPDFIMGEIEINPPVVTIQAPSLSINDIDTLRIDVSEMAYATSYFEITTAPTPLTATGVFFPNIVNELEEVRVTIPIYRVGIAEIAPPTVVGEIAEGFGLIEYDISTMFIEIAGENSAVLSLLPIELPDIDITDLERSREFLIDITDFLPDNIFLTDPAERIIRISVTVEPIVERTFTIPLASISLIGFDPDRMQILTPSIQISAIAYESVINPINSIFTQANLTGLADMPPGEYTINVNVSLPTGLELVGNVGPTIRVLVLEEEIDTEYDYYSDDSED